MGENTFSVLESFEILNIFAIDIFVQDCYIQDFSSNKDLYFAYKTIIIAILPIFIAILTYIILKIFLWIFIRSHKSEKSVEISKLNKNIFK